MTTQARPTETSRRNFIKLLGALGLVAAVPQAVADALIAAPPPLSGDAAGWPFRVVLDGHSYNAERIDIVSGLDYMDPFAEIGRARTLTRVTARLIVNDDEDLRRYLDVEGHVGARIPTEIHISDMGRWYDGRLDGDAFLESWSWGLPDVLGEHGAVVTLRILNGLRWAPR